MPPLPWLAVAVAAGANFVLGGVWYAVCGKPWMAALGKRREDFKPKDPTPFLTAAIGSFVNAAALAWLILAIPACETAAHTAALGGLIGVGIVFAAAAKHYAFSGWSGRLLLIDLGLDVIGFTIMGAVIGAMR
jgi:Protein of unknown function (DUF1761)